MDSAIARRPAAEPVRLRATVKGNFNSPSTPTRQVEIPSDFNPAAPHQIAAGMRVRHLRFGEGKVLSIDGHHDSKVATIFFQGVTNPQRRIMLKFAKLHIIE
jgi:DNA helicase-2/ATP-dependent DNA helicase PcrA